MKILIKNATLVNKNELQVADLLIEDEHISRIGANLRPKGDYQIIDATGKYPLPGVIDNQVRFRKPGLTHKVTIATEGGAAVAGGVTTFFKQPNTVPQAIILEHLGEKFAIAQESSSANYSFFLGGTNNNLEELKRLDSKAYAGMKLFLGSPTGSMLIDNEKIIEAIFSSVDLVIAARCEDEATIRKDLAHYRALCGNDIPIDLHPHIRSAEACYLSSSCAIALAKKTGARLHVLYLSTAAETEPFRNDIPLKDKKITAKVCVYHLWFTADDYDTRRALIKWSPAVKTIENRAVLWQALLGDYLDVIATDHAPHTLGEKQQKGYTNIPSGAPLVRHSLVAILKKVRKGAISPKKIVEKMRHNPAILFDIEDRGYLHESYYADLVLVDMNALWAVQKQNLLYKCGWSPLKGQQFHAKMVSTFVNGQLTYNDGQVCPTPYGQRAAFNR